MTSVRSPQSDGNKGGKTGLAFSRRGLILQLFLVIVLPLTALLLVFTFGSQALHQQAMRALVGERDELAIRTAARALEEQVRQRINAVRLLSLQAEGAETAKLAQLLAGATFLQEDFDLGLAFFNEKGELESANGPDDLWQDLRDELAPIINSLVQGNQPDQTMVHTLRDPQSGEAIAVILAVDQAGQRVTAGATSAKKLAQGVLGNAQAESTNASGDHQAAFLLVDGNRHPIYDTGFSLAEGLLADHPGVAEALEGESGTTYLNEGGNEHVVAYSPVGLVGWGLISEEPWEMVTTPTLRTTQAAPLVLAPALILALVALWFGIRQVVRPLQALEAKSARLAWGDFQAIEQPVGGISEIRHLQAELVHLAHKVQSAQRSLHDYIGVITAAQEDERHRLAHELHDDTIQALIALKQRVQLARLNMGESPMAGAWDEIAALTEQTIDNLRRLTRALRPIYLEDLGLATALEMLAREMGQAAGIPISFNRQGVECRLEPAVELALYRMAQEALNNVARHAEAANASLSIHFAPEAITLKISDDGKGFEVPKSPAEFAPGGHYGLLGMHERAELIGARLEIISEPGKGALLVVRLPRGI